LPGVDQVSFEKPYNNNEEAEEVGEQQNGQYFAEESLLENSRHDQQPDDALNELMEFQDQMK